MSGLPENFKAELHDTFLRWMSEDPESIRISIARAEQSLIRLRGLLKRAEARQRIDRLLDPDYARYSRSIAAAAEGGAV